MKEFIAKNPKQLDLCFKLLYSEGIKFFVEVYENDKRKIEYSISVEVNEAKFAELSETYRILIL